MDNLTRRQRKYTMSQVGQRNTDAEVIFTKFLWTKGVRGYRTNAKILGKPDLYFAQRKVAVFIDGCFWHKCPICKSIPSSNKNYWLPKLRKNSMRDKKTTMLLRKQKRKVLRLWEHEIKTNLNKCYNKFLRIYEKTN